MTKASNAKSTITTYSIRLTDKDREILESYRYDMRLRSIAAVIHQWIQCTPTSIEWMRARVAEYDASQNDD